MKSAYESKEKLIAGLMMGGGAAFISGIFLTFLAMVTRFGLFFAFGPFLIFLGICLGAAALYLGIGHNRRMGGGGVRPQEEGRIIARFAINQIGEMLFDNFDYDAETARYYVKVQFLGGRREEFECARPVFDQCGEGMRGLLTMQGGWLSQFTPLVDTDETRLAYRDW